MSFIAAAVITGGAALAGGYMASRSADKASKRAASAASSELGFAQAQYDDWKDIYGPIEENLGEFYSNLSPEFYEATGLEQVEYEFDTIAQRTREALAQRGIDPRSGIGASLELQQDIAEAEAKAETRMTAPLKAAEAKTGFLSVGMGNPAQQNLSSALAGRTAQLSEQAAVQEAAAGKAVQSAITTVGTGLSDYFKRGAE